ncbi:MAG: RodZ domain-containing protein, partial [Betaproteobacteria bacterium]
AATGRPETAQSASSAPEGAGTAGAVLLSERRRQGLSLGDISRQLKLSVRQIEALERDDYSAYKGPVFIHGFLRNYAKLLGLDPEPLIRATDLMLNPPVVPAATSREPEQLRPVRVDRQKQLLWPAAVVVLLVGIALSVYFNGRRAPDAVRSAPTIAASEAPASVPKLPIETKTGAGLKVRNEPKPGVESAAKPAAKPETKPETMPETKIETKIETKTKPITESVELRPALESGAAVAAESTGRVTVRMIFEQDSWVEIKDRAGNTIFGQLNPAGSRRSVKGEAPLSLVVGNAAGVRLFQGEKSIDLAPHTRVDVARLTLE